MGLSKEALFNWLSSYFWRVINSDKQVTDQCNRFYCEHGWFVKPCVFWEDSSYCFLNLITWKWFCLFSSFFFYVFQLPNKINLRRVNFGNLVLYWFFVSQKLASSMNEYDLLMINFSQQQTLAIRLSKTFPNTFKCLFD